MGFIDLKVKAAKESVTIVIIFYLKLYMITIVTDFLTAFTLLVVKYVLIKYKQVFSKYEHTDKTWSNNREQPIN